ncbi:helix-turn-helix domain-containing protein [Clostridioides difficile]|uniref:helix-turn-helix domain-containing protein n=1 Tax=Clostridioides difficile TaxID=1496 RepID=UPI0028A572DA|nr:helix-turn-helix domain-containing protein [Clostridioides difficile]KAK2207849.1 hypothetical protein CDPitt_04575 [Clostridioides difficile]
MIDNETDDLSPIVVNGIMNLNDAYKIVDQIMISKAINKYGSITKAAEVIGIYPSTIHRKIKSGHIQIQLKRDGLKINLITLSHLFSFINI